MDNYRKITKEHADIAPVVALLQRLSADRGRHRRRPQDMAADPEMREFAEDEVKAGKAQAGLAGNRSAKTVAAERPERREEHHSWKSAAAPAATNRALFAGDLFRMYARFAERNRWQVEIISEIARRGRRLQGSHRAHRRPGRVFTAEIRIRRASRAARARDRDAGAHPYLGCDRRGHAGSR